MKQQTRLPSSRNSIMSKNSTMKFFAIISCSIVPFVTSFGSPSNVNVNANSVHNIFRQSSISAPTLHKVQNKNILFPKFSSSSSPLFVAQAQDINGDNDANTAGADPLQHPVIKSLDAEMEKMKKNRDRYQEKLNQFEQGLEKLQVKKQQYLEGFQLGQPPVGGNFSETTVRSAVKAFLWRVVAGSVTLITSLKFSGSLSMALKVVSSDFFSKALTMFIGERIMNKSQAGRKTGADSAGRSVAKALIWRLFAICNTLTVACLFSGGDLTMASKIAGSDAIFKTALMVAYERVWARIEWGKEYNIEFSI